MLSDFEERLPEDDKVFIVSFFKGSLDLLEAVFRERQPNVGIARYDGDVRADEREEQLSSIQKRIRLVEFF